MALLGARRRAPVTGRRGEQRAVPVRNRRAGAPDGGAGRREPAGSAPGAPARRTEARGWESLLDDAETALAFADLVEAHDLLISALEAGGTTSAAQARALEIEAAIRRRLELPDDLVVVAAPGGAHGPLDEVERWIVAGADQPRTVGELARLGRTDSLRARVVVAALLRCGLLRAAVARP